MDQANTDSISVQRSDLVAISRLLWDLGSQDGTNDQHRVLCYHWGASLDRAIGTPWPTQGEPISAAIDFYEGVKVHLEAVIARLRWGDPESRLYS
jgi:hypothetical protein